MRKNERRQRLKALHAQQRQAKAAKATGEQPESEPPDSDPVAVAANQPAYRYLTSTEIASILKQLPPDPEAVGWLGRDVLTSENYIHCYMGPLASVLTALIPEDELSPEERETLQTHGRVLIPSTESRSDYLEIRWEPELITTLVEAVGRTRVPIEFNEGRQLREVALTIDEDDPPTAPEHRIAKKFFQVDYDRISDSW